MTKKPAGGVTQASGTKPEGIQTQVKQAGATALLDDPAVARAWHKAAIDLEPKLAGFGPLAAYDPATLLALNAARRNLGDHKTADEALAKYLANQPGFQAGSAGRLGPVFGDGALADRRRPLRIRRPALTPRAASRKNGPNSMLDSMMRVGPTPN